MIADVLRRSFLLRQLDDVESTLRELAAQSGPDDDVAETLDAIEAARASGAPGQPDDGDAELRRGDDNELLDEHAFLSREPVLSLLQSVLEEWIETNQPEDIEEDADADRRDGEGLPAITDRRLIGGEDDGGGTDRFGGRFELTDLRWVAHFGLAKAVRAYRDRHPFNPRPAPPVELAQRARLVMVGDWASGLPRARRVAEQMREMVEEGREDDRQVHVVHLGDVYYSGFKREYEKRFLPYWPVEKSESEDVFSWNVNGNHDMYSGGHGYFDVLRTDPRFARQNGSSWFSIENEHWRIVGLDTAWDEKALIHDSRDVRGLQNPQTEVLSTMAAEDERPFMLLSHHQLFSSYEHVGRSVADKLRPLLDAERIRAWFWGHEHKCVAYEPYEGVAYGRCVGHGGVPVYAVGDPKHEEPEVTWVEQRAFDGWGEQWALFGFAVVDLDGPDAHVTYVDENGDVPWDEEFSAA